jgi:precorrin-6Y C5,15-methyltransferase (decarboxylating)
VLPAPSTLQMAFARFRKPWQDLRIASCHSADAGEWFVGATPGARPVPADAGDRPAQPLVALFTSPENGPARLARALITAGYGDEVRMSVACRLLLPDERLFADLPAARPPAA